MTTIAINNIIDIVHDEIKNVIPFKTVSKRIRESIIVGSTPALDIAVIGTEQRQFAGYYEVDYKVVVRVYIVSFNKDKNKYNMNNIMDSMHNKIKHLNNIEISTIKDIKTSVATETESDKLMQIGLIEFNAMSTIN